MLCRIIVFDHLSLLNSNRYNFISPKAGIKVDGVKKYELFIYSTSDYILKLFTLDSKKNTALLVASELHSKRHQKREINSQQISVVYNDLKTTIINPQQVMKKYEEFLKIFQKLILLDLWVASNHNLNIYITIVNLFQGIVQTKLEITTGVALLKCSLALFISIVQIFLMCVQNDILHQNKDSIIFALYNNNWTEMDMKCKILILFTMKINNAHQQKLQRLFIVEEYVFDSFFKVPITYSSIYIDVQIMRRKIKLGKKLCEMAINKELILCKIFIVISAVELLYVYYATIISHILMIIIRRLQLHCRDSDAIDP
ncbi:hypothetical protein AGLY_008117 [Aphis glycines]|uniref:Odorant receptor n=1 Tax=Aphis glycines TaxID=307491 RepID=A0A6G0TKW9_APHGL|nr:hypothetical protein AGLY_008117 [Aphis glycines]